MAGTGLTEEMNNSIRLAEAIHRLAGIFFPQEISANSHQLVQDLPDKPDKPTPGGAERGLHPGGLDLSGSSSSLAYAKLYSAHYYSMLLCTSQWICGKSYRRRRAQLWRVASLLADSRSLDEKKGIIPPRAEFMSAAEWEG